MDKKLFDLVIQAGLPRWATDDHNGVNIADRLVELDRLIREDERQTRSDKQAYWDYVGRLILDRLKSR